MTRSIALAAEVAEHRPVTTGSRRAAAENVQFFCVTIVMGHLKTAMTGT